MQIIRPIAISDANLTSNVPETDGPVWSALGSYGLGQVVIDGAHQCFESLIEGNTGNALTDSAKWLPLGATNRWRMFDGSVGRLTSQAGTIDVAVSTNGRIDGLALLNLTGREVQVTLTSPDLGVLYDETHSLTSDSGISDWYAYFSEEIVYLTDLVLVDLPLTSNVTLAASISTDSGSASVGEMVVGQTRDLGDTVYPARGGIIDYSRKNTDEFGATTLVERSYAKRNSFKVIMPAGSADAVYSLLAQYRATPVVWFGTDTYALTWIYGWARDFSIELNTPSHSTLSLEVEGLT